ncbi:MAG: alpha/beta hydrolase [Candidatus Binatia bacterium]
MIRKALLPAVALALAVAPDGSRADAEVVDQPVAFEVVNKNHSLVPCQSDGKTYTLHGSLVAPESVLDAEKPAVTLYVHGAILAGDNLWRMRPEGDDSFDFGLAMARLGHASVSIELVGYGGSVTADRPDGNLVCQGSHADVIHQVVDTLRAGGYDFGGTSSGPAFDRVAVAGLSYGAQFAQPTVYSFRNVDALIVMGYAEPFPGSPEFWASTPEYGAGCLRNDHKYDDGSGPAGYTTPRLELVPAWLFNDPDPRAEAEVIRLAERDPCGQLSSAGVRIATDAAHLGEIDVPVLLTYGDHDEVMGQPGPQIHFLRFAGSSDRTLMLFPGAGHVFFLEKNRAAWIGMIAGWLEGHGF